LDESNLPNSCLASTTEPANPVFMKTESCSFVENPAKALSDRVVKIHGNSSTKPLAPASGMNDKGLHSD